MLVKCRLALSAAIVLGLSAPAFAQPIYYQDSDRINNVPVSTDAPLPVEVVGSGSLNDVNINEVGGNPVTDEVPTHDADLLAAVAGEVPAGDEEIGKVTPTISNLTRGTITSAMTGTTSTLLLAAPASSIFNYITQVTCSNMDADTDTVIGLQDGNGGTTFYSAPAAKLGGGFALSFPVPLKQPTAATALYVVNETTGATTKCSASGFTR